MDLLAPLSRIAELEPLVRAGATDVYCGLYDSTWRDRWGLAAWPNRRGPGPGNLESEEDLARICEAARRLGVRLHLAINAPLLDGDQESALVRLAARATDQYGVHGLIVGHPGLLGLLRERAPTASTLCTARNPDAVRFLAEMGARRVILGRQLTLVEIGRIRSAVPDVEIEAFVLNDACVFEEGSCFTGHAVPGWHGPYCLAERVVADRDGEAATRVASRRDWIDALGNADLVGPEHIPGGPCGLCALPDLAGMGVDGVKIVGREAHPYRKVRSVQAVRHVLDGLEQGGASEARKRALDLRADTDLCRSGLSCYYPEARPGHV